MTDEQILGELQRIRMCLELLAFRDWQAVRTCFAKLVIKSEEKSKVLWAIDGHRNAEELAACAGVSTRTAQRLIKEATDAGWVAVGRDGHALVPTLNLDRILEWYVGREGESENG